MVSSFWTGFEKYFLLFWIFLNAAPARWQATGVISAVRVEGQGSGRIRLKVVYVAPSGLGIILDDKKIKCSFWLIVLPEIMEESPQTWSPDWPLLVTHLPFCSLFRKVAPSTSSSPVPRRCSWRSSSRCWRSTTGRPSPWWPRATTATRTSWPWWRAWRTAPSSAGRRRAWWFSMWRTTPAELGPNGCSRTMKPRWEGGGGGGAPG